jgi:hypothetical protein
MGRAEIVARAQQAAFGKPLVTNVLRSILVEAMLAEALAAEWTWCAADYASCDFVHRDGARLEVKQSAAKQSWHNPDSAPSKPSFDIAERTGRWEGSIWIAEPGCNAEIYVFAYHPVTSADADHREPAQWRFFVAPASLLPPGKSLSLAGVKRLSAEHGFADIASAVETIRSRASA